MVISTIQKILIYVSSARDMDCPRKFLKPVFGPKPEADIPIYIILFLWALFDLFCLQDHFSLGCLCCLMFYPFLMSVLYTAQNQLDLGS